jgi:hypothetical protein
MMRARWHCPFGQEQVHFPSAVRRAIDEMTAFSIGLTDVSMDPVLKAD